MKSGKSLREYGNPVVVLLRIFGLLPVNVYRDLSSDAIILAELSVGWERYSRALLVFHIANAILRTSLYFRTLGDGFYIFTVGLMKVHCLWVMSFVTYRSRAVIKRIGLPLKLFARLQSSCTVLLFFVFLATASCVIIAPSVSVLLELYEDSLLDLLTILNLLCDTFGRIIWLPVFVLVNSMFILTIYGVYEEISSIKNDIDICGSFDKIHYEPYFVKRHLILWKMSRDINNSFSVQLLLSVLIVFAQAVVGLYTQFKENSKLSLVFAHDLIGIVQMSIFASACFWCERISNMVSCTSTNILFSLLLLLRFAFLVALRPLVL